MIDRPAIATQRRRLRRGVLGALLLALIALGVVAAVESGRFSSALPVRIELGSRAVSKTPFFIAADQGLFARYGVNVDLRMPPSEVPNALGDRGFMRRGLDILLRRFPARDMVSNGITPDMVEVATNALVSPVKALASTDCVLRSYFIGRHGLESVDDLKGKRIGITGLLHNITGYAALELARRQGWDPVHDMSIVLNGDKVDLLRQGRVDAIVAMEEDLAEAREDNFPMLLSTRTWGDLPVGGNTLQVTAAWLEDESHREAARRVLKALVHGIAIFHENRELTIDVLQRWKGVGRRYAEIMYDEAAIPRKPYPCYEGIKRTMQVFDSHAMRQYKPEDFYDDSFLKELDASGFIDEVYASAKAAR